MQKQMWKRLYLSAAVAAAAIVILTVWSDSSILMNIDDTRQYVERNAGGWPPSSFLRETVRNLDSSVTVVTSLPKEIMGNTLLLDEILSRPWPHPMLIYVHTTFFKTAKQRAKASCADFESRFVFQPVPDAFVDTTQLSHRSVDMLINATSADPFRSDTFFWSHPADLVALPEDSMVPFDHAREISVHYPEAVVYHHSRPLVRPGIGELPPEIVTSQFACPKEACRLLYLSYQAKLSKSSQPRQALIHAQLCLENPERCVLIHASERETREQQMSLWRLLSNLFHPPVIWNQLAVCTLVRDKNEYLPEWIEFHRLQGFDQFLIYDDASRSPSLFLDSYIDDGIVTLVDWSTTCKNATKNHEFASCQRAAFADCQQRIMTQWLGVFDVDVFLFATPPNSATDTVLAVLQQQPEIVASVRFVGAQFENRNRTYLDFPRNKSDMVLVTEQYTLRQPVHHEEGTVDALETEFFQAPIEIARLKCLSPLGRGIHGFMHGACPNALTAQFHIANPTSALRMHHYQHLSVLQSQLNARLDGNPHVAISNPVEHAAYNMIQDNIAAVAFGERIRSALLERNHRGANGAIPRGVTLVLTSAGRIDLLNRTLETFRRHNTYPIARAIIIEDSGQAGIVDFARDMFDIPIEIIYNPDLGDQRHHKIGMLGLIDCVDLAYSHVETEFIFHMEDDWEFVRPGFIERSIDILDADPSLIQVWLRAHNDGHWVLPEPFHTPRNRTYQLMDPDYGGWHGFSFNPGLRRLHDYKVLGTTFYEATKPHQQQIASEFDINLLYYRLGYRAAITDVAEGFVRHIGWGRTTDPTCSQGC